MEIAELAIADRDAGMVGFDIAGAEAGYPPTRHLDAFEYLQSPDQRHLDDPRTRPARRRLRLRPAQLPLVRHQRDEVRLHPLRRTPDHHRQRHQALVRRPAESLSQRVYGLSRNPLYFEYSPPFTWLSNIINCSLTYLMGLVLVWVKVP
jgi:hypothetical protein